MIPLAVLASSKVDVPTSEKLNSMNSMGLLNSEKVIPIEENKEDSEVVGCITFHCSGCTFSVYIGGSYVGNYSTVKIC